MAKWEGECSCEKYLRYSNGVTNPCRGEVEQHLGPERRSGSQTFSGMNSHKAERNGWHAENWLVWTETAMLSTEAWIIWQLKYILSTYALQSEGGRISRRWGSCKVSVGLLLRSEFVTWPANRCLDTGIMLRITLFLIQLNSTIYAYTLQIYMKAQKHACSMYFSQCSPLPPITSQRIKVYCLRGRDTVYLLITDCGSTLYLGITVEFLDNWVFDLGIIQANKLQKPTTKLQIDLHCLAVHKNTNKRT